MQQKNLQTTGLSIFTVSLGILLRRPEMVKNERFSDLTKIIYSFIFSFYLLSLGPVNHLLSLISYFIPTQDRLRLNSLVFWDKVSFENLSLLSSD